MRVVIATIMLFISAFGTSNARTEEVVLGSAEVTVIPTEKADLYNLPIEQIPEIGFCTTRFVHCGYDYVALQPDADGNWNPDQGFEPLGGTCTGTLTVKVTAKILAYQSKYEELDPIFIPALRINGYRAYLPLDSKSGFLFVCRDGKVSMSDMYIGDITQSP